MKKIIKKIFYIYLICVASSTYAHDTFAQKTVQRLCRIFPDNYGVQPLAPEHEDYIRTIIHEMGITKPIHIRKMNRLALSIYGINNAFALLDNYLFISESFFTELSEREKRFLIGHELAHLLRNHSYKKIAFLSINPIIAAASSLGTGITLRKFCKINNYFINTINIASCSIYVIVSKLLLNKMLRLQEIEADHIAASMLNNHEGGIVFLERMDKVNMYNYSTWFNRIIATHPSPQERIKQLQKNIPNENIQGKADD